MAHDSLPSPLSPPHAHSPFLGPIGPKPHQQLSPSQHLNLRHTHTTSPPPSPVLPPTQSPSIATRPSASQGLNKHSPAKPRDAMPPPPSLLPSHGYVGGPGPGVRSSTGPLPCSTTQPTAATATNATPTSAVPLAPSSKPLWREPVHLVALVHFCELTGPSIVFVSQPVHGWEVTELAEIHDPIPMLPPSSGEPPDPLASSSNSNGPPHSAANSSSLIVGSNPASSAELSGTGAAVGNSPGHSNVSINDARARATTNTSAISSSSASSSDNASMSTPGLPSITVGGPSSINASTSSVPAYAHHPPTTDPNGSLTAPSAPMCPACHPTLPFTPEAIADLWSVCAQSFPSLVPTLSSPPPTDLVPIAAKPALVSPLGAARFRGSAHADPNPLLVASARYPLRVDLYPVLKSASVRSLSCEVAPSNRAGPLLYTLEVPGFALPFSVVSQAFSLADAASRGGVRAYALLFLTNHSDHVTRWWDTIVARFGYLVNQLVGLAEAVSSGGQLQHQEGQQHASGTTAAKLELSPEQFLKKRGNPLPRIKSLVDIVGVKTVFISLHLHFAALLRDTWISCSPCSLRPTASPTSQRQSHAVIHGVTYPLPPARPQKATSNPGVPAQSFLSATAALVVDGDGTLTPPATPTAPSTCMSFASASSSPTKHPPASPHLPRHLPPTSAATDPALTVLFHLAFHLPRPDLLTLLTHLATGDQVILRGASDLATPLLHALAHVLPDDCATVVENSPTYRESWECNLLGVDSYVALPLNTLRENGAGYCVVDVDEVSVRVAYDYLPPPAAAVTGGTGAAAGGIGMGGGGASGFGAAGGGIPANPRSSMAFASTGSTGPTGAAAGGVGSLPSVARIAVDVARVVDGAKALAGSQWLAAHPCLPPTAGSTTGATALLGSSASTSSLRWAANMHHPSTISSSSSSSSLSPSSSSSTCLPPRVLAALRLALTRVQTTWLTRAGDFAATLRRATLHASLTASSHVPLSPFATAANPATAVVGALVNPESAVPMAIAHCHANASEWSIGSTASATSGMSHHSPGPTSSATAAAAARPIVVAARAVAKQASLLSLSSLLGSSWRKNSSTSSVNVSGAAPAAAAGGGPGSSAAQVTAQILSSSPATVSGATGKQYLGNVRRATPSAQPTMGNSSHGGGGGTTGSMGTGTAPAPASLAALFPGLSSSASTGMPAAAPPPYISTASGGYASGSSGAHTPSSPLSSPFTESGVGIGNAGAGEVRFRDDLDVQVLKFWGRAAKRRGYGAIARSSGY